MVLLNAKLMSDSREFTWNPDLGLCRQDSPGHTAAVAQLPAVHNGVITVTHLCLEAQEQRLEADTALRTLASLRAMQVLTPGDRHGCLKWY